MGYEPDAEPSFRGILSPFAADCTPLQEEALPEETQRTLALPSHARSKSGGQHPANPHEISVPIYGGT